MKPSISEPQPASVRRVCFMFLTRDADAPASATVLGEDNCPIDGFVGVSVRTGIQYAAEHGCAVEAFELDD